MKTALMIVLSASVMLISGCATSTTRFAYAINTPASGQSVSYDPVKDMTTVSNSNDGFTWYLRGNATNVMLSPR
jgi:hypothetical protein